MTSTILARNDLSETAIINGRPSSRLNSSAGLNLEKAGGGRTYWNLDKMVIEGIVDSNGDGELMQTNQPEVDNLR